MLKSGECLCHVCGRVSHKAVYFNAERNIAVDLKRTPLIGTACLEVCGEAKNKVRLTGRTHLGAELPQVIYAKIDDEPGDVMFRRICPQCMEDPIDSQDGAGRTTYLFPGQGGYPTYVIVFAGFRGVGKSTWSRAVRYAANYNQLNAYFQGKIRFQPVQTVGGMTVDAATNVNDAGESTLIDLYEIRTKKGKEQTNRKFASVLLIDMAGELYQDDKIAGAQRGRFYEYADAVLVLDSADPNCKEAGKVNELYNKMRGLGYLDSVRTVAHVVTCLDILCGNPPRNGADGTVPLLDSTTFPAVKNTGADVYGREALLQRIALQNILLKKYSPSACDEISKDPTHRAGFLIQTCEPSGENQSSLQMSVNVMDPLVWIMDELGLLPVH